MSLLAASSASLILLAREPLAVDDLRALAACNDVRVSELLAQALENRFRSRRRFGDGILPDSLDAEITEALKGLEHLDPDRALDWGRRLAAETRPIWAAREVLARAGDVDIVRRGLREYFDEPELWGRVLGEARLAQEDPRLCEFAYRRRDSHMSEALLGSRLERNLAISTLPRTQATLMENGKVSASLLSRIPPGGAFDQEIDARLELLSATAGDPEERLYAALGIERRRGRRRVLEPRENVEGYPYLARSPNRADRERVIEASGGRALAALLLSTTATLDEKERALRRNKDAVVEAVRFGGSAVLWEAKRLALRAPELAVSRDAEALAARPQTGSGPKAEDFLALARAEAPNPGLAASLFVWYERDPKGFAALLSDRHPVVRRRVVAALALHADREATLPLLVDAVMDGDALTRSMAFRGLAEAKLDRIAFRLHRLAGDSDRAVRFETALALVPTGEPWAVRLLVASVDETSPVEVARARRALGRAPRPSARETLLGMVADGTANVFAVNALLEEVTFPPAVRSRAWEIVAPRIPAANAALLAASRLGGGAPTRAVLRFLERRRTAALTNRREVETIRAALSPLGVGAALSPCATGVGPRRMQEKGPHATNRDD